MSRPATMRQPKSSDRRLILFSRYPVPGRTKTRLMPVLGTLGAAEMQRRLTEQSLRTLLAWGRAPVEVHHCGGREYQMRRWLGCHAVRLVPQCGPDLGQRMQAALETALGQGVRRAVLVGSDVPQMHAAHLRDAFEALERHDLVLGPSLDGGYWLVGCRRPADVFRHIDWGTPQVLAQTLSAARRSGVSVHLLCALNDIDTPADLIAWQPRAEWRRPYLSVIIPTLDEERHIEGVVAHVHSSEVEVIVVDGGSRDATAFLARRAGATVIQAPRGRAAQQNAGAAMARGEMLLFLHADTRLPMDFGAMVFDLLMDPGVVAGAFHFRTDCDHWAMRLIEKSVRIRSTLLRLPYGDQALFLRRSTFDQVGGFPQVPLAEDLLLVRRLARLGRVAIAPAFAVTSARRWRRIGLLRATLINYLIAVGCLLGVSPRRMAPFYRKAT